MAAQFPLVKVNPLQVRRFAQAHGVRTKTDKVDARMLAVMGQGVGAITSRETIAEAVASLLAEYEQAVMQQAKGSRYLNAATADRARG